MFRVVCEVPESYHHLSHISHLLSLLRYLSKPSSNTRTSHSKQGLLLKDLKVLWAFLFILGWTGGTAGGCLGLWVECVWTSLSHSRKNCYMSKTPNMMTEEGTARSKLVRLSGLSWMGAKPFEEGRGRGFLPLLHNLWGHSERLMWNPERTLFHQETGCLAPW